MCQEDVKKFFLEYPKTTDILRIRIENQNERRFSELDGVYSSDFIEVWNSKIRDLEKFRSKNFFDGNDFKPIPYYSHAQTKAHDTVLGSNERILMILWTFEIFVLNRNESNTIRTAIENKEERHRFEAGRLIGSDFMAFWSFRKPTLRKISAKNRKFFFGRSSRNLAQNDPRIETNSKKVIWDQSSRWLRF